MFFSGYAVGSWYIFYRGRCSYIERRVSMYCTFAVIDPFLYRCGNADIYPRLNRAILRILKMLYQPGQNPIFSWTFAGQCPDWKGSVRSDVLWIIVVCYRIKQTNYCPSTLHTVFSPHTHTHATSTSMCQVGTTGIVVGDHQQVNNIPFKVTMTTMVVSAS